MCTTPTTRHYLVMAQDPVHVGAGGYRLGRVDNTIIREPGTNCPKVPGTSLSGAIRSYAAMHLGSRCAGTRGCGQDGCAVCYTFGSAPQEGVIGPQSQYSYQGTVRLTDAQVVLFPIYTMLGPAWMTTPETLATTFGVDAADVALPDPDAVRTTLDTRRVGGRLNLSWLLLGVGTPLLGNLAGNDLWAAVPGDIKARLIVVSEKLYGQLMNSNLEVRTSVAIDPETGAAEEKKLFTFEALPRGSYLAFDVVVHDYRGNDEIDPVAVLESGLGYLGTLGVGGMSTRGFGRLAIVYPTTLQSLARE